MLHEHIGGFPPDGREEFGKFLRHAFPIGLASFEGLASAIDEETGNSVLEIYARSLTNNGREQ
jgi:hypothetical protein